MSRQTDKILTFFEGVTERDLDGATKWLSEAKYVEHDPFVADGVAGVKDFVRHMANVDDQQVVRIFEDGPYVFTQTNGNIAGLNTFFDVFRFEDDLIVEHWRFASKAGPPNKSGHTQVDGPTQARDLAETEQNKAFLRDYYETFHLKGNHDRSGEYFVEGHMIRHEPGVSDGVQEFLSDVKVLMQHRTIDRIRLLLGQGDFVFLVAEGSHEGKPCLYIDLYRIEKLKIVEHWGFPQMVPHAGTMKNANGML